MLRVRDNELINCCEDIVLIFDDIVHVEYMQILWNIYIWEREKLVFGLTFLNDSSIYDDFLIFNLKIVNCN